MATRQAAKPATRQAAKPATRQAAKPATRQAAKPAKEHLLCWRENPYGIETELRLVNTDDRLFVGYVTIKTPLVTLYNSRLRINSETDEYYIATPSYKGKDDKFYHHYYLNSDVMNEMYHEIIGQLMDYLDEIGVH